MMVLKICLFATLMIKCVTGLTNIDDLVAADGGNAGDYWDDDFVYDDTYAASGFGLPTMDAWYQGTPDSDLGGTVTCSDCGGEIHGWYYATTGSYAIYTQLFHN